MKDIKEKDYKMISYMATVQDAQDYVYSSIVQSIAMNDRQSYLTSLKRFPQNSLLNWRERGCEEKKLDRD